MDVITGNTGRKLTGSQARLLGRGRDAIPQSGVHPLAPFDVNSDGPDVWIVRKGHPTQVAGVGNAPMDRPCPDRLTILSGRHRVSGDAPVIDDLADRVSCSGKFSSPLRRRGANAGKFGRIEQMGVITHPE